MATYIQAQFDKVRDLASAESDTIQFTLQIVGPVGKTNHLNITIGQINAIQKILEPVITETKLVPKRFLTKKRADFLAKEYSKKYLTFWYVRQISPKTMPKIGP